MDRPIRSIIEDQTPVTAAADMTVAAASRLMKEKRVSAILVLDGGRLAGIFTERDALFRVIAEGRAPESTTLADVMTRNPRTIAPDRPTWWKPPFATLAMRAPASTPAIYATSSAAPEASSCAAVPSAAGKVLTVRWMTPAACVSS